jgi:phospholipid transport system substrate-binding protein
MRFLLPWLASALFANIALAAPTPRDFIEALIAEYRTMQPGKSESLSEADRAHNETVRRDLLSRLDVEKLGQLALADHWESLSPEKRTEFLGVLREVLQERSLKNIRGTTERFEVQYDGVDELPDGEALVKTILQLKSDEFYVDFKLQPKDDGWIIYDVITDDVSTIRNYRDQFNKIIAENGFEELLRRMRENLLDEPPASKSKEPEAG